jgi:tetratricopeptide (TPR) repeat protein
LGSGASGEVFLALDRETGGEVAVKLFFADAAPTAESEGEIGALGALSHDRIVKLLDHGIHAGRPFTVCEFVRGMSLKERFAAGPPATREEVVRSCDFLLQILGALDHVHAAGLLHRDLKPANVHLEFTAAAELPPAADLPASPFLKAKLLDFGFARRRGRAEERFEGTPAYAAPEQIRSPALGDERADLFAAGAVLYEALTGKPPFTSLQALMSGEAPAAPHVLNPAVPEEVSAPALALLAASPFKRPASAAEAAERLEGALHPQGLAFQAPPPPPGGANALTEDAVFLMLSASARPRTAPARALLDRVLAATGGLAALCAPHIEALHRGGGLARRFGELAAVDAPPEPARVAAFPALDAGLNGEERAFLGAAACLREFTAEEAAAAAAAPVATIRALLARLQDAALLRSRGGVWSFTAALARAHFAAALPAAEIRALHERAAAVRRAAPAEVRAYHLRGAGRSAEAFGLYLDAATARESGGRLQEAHALVEEALALEHAPTDIEALRLSHILLAAGNPRRALELLRSRLRAPERAGARESEFLLAAGRAALRAGEFAEACASFSRAAELLAGKGTPRELLECERGLGAACRSLGDLAEAEAAYRRMAAHAAAAADRTGTIEALHGAGLVAKDRGDLAAAERDLSRAAAEADAIGDRRRAAVAWHNLGNVLRAADKHREAAELFRAAIAARKTIGDRHGLAITYTSLAQEDARRGDLRAALEALRQSQRLFLEAGDRKGLAVVLINRGLLLGAQGDFEEALATFRRASLLAARLGDARNALEADLAAAEILVIRGDAEAEDILSRARAAPTATDRTEARALALLASAALRRGALDEAQALAEDAAARLPSHRNVEENAELRGLCAEILNARGEHDAAVQIAREAYLRLPDTAAPQARGRLARILGEAWLEMGPMWADRTEKHLREAETLLAGAGYVYELARARLAWARYLAYAGEAGEALRVAAAARAVFVALGADREAALAARLSTEVS